MSDKPKLEYATSLGYVPTTNKMSVGANPDDDVLYLYLWKSERSKKPSLRIPLPMVIDGINQLFQEHPELD